MRVFILALCVALSNCLESEGPFKTRMVHEGSDRNGVPDKNYRWPAASGLKGVMPYTIDSTEIGGNEANFINRVIERFNIDLQGCLAIVPRTSQSSYVRIGKEPNACNSWVGNLPNANDQKVNLDGFVGAGGCYSDGTVIHELVHAWGFHHEQTRADRDDYVTINTNNIQPNMMHNFNKNSGYNSFGVRYDGLSIMHYSNRAFSTNGQYTIVSKRPDIFTTEQMGTNNWLSAGDVSKLRTMYGCDGPGSDCQNKYSNCNDLASRGACEGYPSWMKGNCPSACNFCKGLCEDTSPHCAGYVEKYGCSQSSPSTLQNHRAIQQQCRKTCNLCPSNCKNNDYFPLNYGGTITYKTCAYWSTKHFFDCKHPFFARNCRKQCGQCLGMDYLAAGRSDYPVFPETQLPEFQNIPEFQNLPEFQEFPEFQGNGKGKGNPKGKGNAKGNPKGKGNGKGNPKGKGNGKGKGKSP